jgi:hypothetical protein
MVVAILGGGMVDTGQQQQLRSSVQEVASLNLWLVRGAGRSAQRGKLKGPA